MTPGQAGVLKLWSVRTLDELRAVCAGLPHSQETFPFDLTTLVFKVGGKMYALTSIDADPPSVSKSFQGCEEGRVRQHGVVVSNGF